jgi:hypothetical protein
MLPLVNPSKDFSIPKNSQNLREDLEVGSLQIDQFLKPSNQYISIWFYSLSGLVLVPIFEGCFSPQGSVAGFHLESHWFWRPWESHGNPMGFRATSNPLRIFFRKSYYYGKYYIGNFLNKITYNFPYGIS